MAGFSLLVRRETIRRIASSGSTSPSEGFDSSSLAVMVDGVNAAVDRMSQGFAEGCGWTIDATTKIFHNAVRSMDVVALRVAQEILPVWYRMTPEVRVPLLGVGVTVSPSWCRAAGCLDVTTISASLLAFIRIFSLGSFICATLLP
jgi:hypothetical protein